MAENLIKNYDFLDFFRNSRALKETFELKTQWNETQKFIAAQNIEITTKKFIFIATQT